MSWIVPMASSTHRCASGSLDGMRPVPLLLYLKEIRRQAKVRQEALKEAIGDSVSRGHLSKLENNKANWTRETVEVVAAGLRKLGVDVQPYHLLGYKHPPDIDQPRAFQALMAIAHKLNSGGLEILLDTAKSIEARGMVKINESATSSAGDAGVSTDSPNQST